MPKTYKGRGPKRSPLNMRTTPERRRQLEKAAAKNGRSLIQEVEFRLEQSFARETEGANLWSDVWSLPLGPHMAAVLLAAGWCAEGLGRFSRWTDKSEGNKIHHDDTVWNRNSPQVQAAILMLQTMNHPSSDRARLLSSGTIPEHIKDADDVEINGAAVAAVAVALRTLCDPKQTGPIPDFVRLQLEPLIDELSAHRLTKEGGQDAR